MNNKHVQGSNHIHDHPVREKSITPGHNHVSIDDYHSIMKMYFHTDFTETILFDPWITTSIPRIFIGSWIFIFILGILYEGIRKFRQTFEEEQLIKRSIILDDGNENELTRMNTESPESTHRIKKKIPPSYTERTLDSILYIIQLALSYTLMLIAMTFNVYLFFAIILGVGVGHLLYTWSYIKPSPSKNQPRTGMKQ